jgi:uncharacterized protein HemY
MQSVGKILVIFGIITVFIGIILIFFDKIPIIGKLPGDIRIEKENFKFYFPITTCIIISVIASLIFFLISFLTKK